VTHADAARRRRLRQEILMVFQNPFGSLNPRQTIGKALGEPLLVSTSMRAPERKAAALAIMEKVGLRPEYYHRYPHMFPAASGSASRLPAPPQHSYIRALLTATPVAVPGAKRERILLTGESPSPIDPPPGCPFNPRCPLAFDRCRLEKPRLERKQGRDVTCFAVES
jgi:oligopeptide/dipeptide ABC transporter ATP-binding protein